MRKNRSLELFLMFGFAAALAVGGCAKKEAQAPAASNEATAPTPTGGGKIPVTTASAEAKTEFLQGRDMVDKLLITDSVVHFQKAVALDPLSTATRRALGVQYAKYGRLDDAVAELHAALDLNPKAGAVHSALCDIRLRQGRTAEALTEAELEAIPILRLTSIAIVRHTLGHAADSDAALSEVITDHASIAAYDIAQVYAWRGEVDHAFEWLVRAYAQRDTGMPLLATDRLLAPLHDDPRWSPFIKKMGFG